MSTKPTIILEKEYVSAEDFDLPLLVVAESFSPAGARYVQVQLPNGSFQWLNPQQWVPAQPLTPEELQARLDTLWG